MLREYPRLSGCAFADLLLINGNPLEDICILSRPEVNLAVIMKGGKTYKNTVD